MKWKHPAFLMPDRLVLLNFGSDEIPIVIGCVGVGGACEWPESKNGQRPTGWNSLLEAQAILSGSGAKHADG